MYGISYNMGSCVRNKNYSTLYVVSRMQCAWYKDKEERQAFVLGTSVLVTLVGDVSWVEARVHCVLGWVGGACSGTLVSSREWCYGAPSEGGTYVAVEVVGHCVLGRWWSNNYPPRSIMEVLCTPCTPIDHPSNGVMEFISTQPPFF